MRTSTSWFFVHYNLKLHIKQFEDEMQSLHQMQSIEQEDFDPCSILMEVALYDEGNPIMDWLWNSRSESVPTLDEYDCSEPESPNNPSTFLVEELGMNEEELATFKRSLILAKKKVVRKERWYLRKILETILNQILISKVAQLMQSQETAVLMVVKAVVCFIF